MDIQYLMRQAKKLEKAMADARDTLGEIAVDAESGGGLVKVKLNGKCEIVRITIDPKAVDPAEVSMLEDLLSAALNAAVEKARAAADAHMAKATGGIKIPGVG
jgi:DNA-binding YbaB/EbfC family protein